MKHVLIKFFTNLMRRCACRTMFYRQILIYFLFVGTIVYSENLLNNDVLPSHVIKTHLKSASEVNTHITNNTDIRNITGHHKVKSYRQRRGIILIDEDFDKFPEATKQSWNSDNSKTNDEPAATQETEKDLFTEDGSGSSQFPFSPNSIEATFKSTNSPKELFRTKEKSNTSSTSIDTVEGSGDDSFTSLSTTTIEDLQITDNFMLPNCLNSTCDDKELAILPGFTETVPEETSLILLCSVSNPTNKDLLRWYRNNDSNSFLLETVKDSDQLKFVLPQAKIQDSGIYICVRLSKDSCCHRKLDVTIYRKPNYKYHLLTVGLVAAVSLFTCLLLSIHRKYKLRQYKKECKTQIPLNEFLL